MFKIGSSASGIDISASLVGHAKKIINIFESPHLIAPSILEYKTQSKEIEMFPSDMLFFSLSFMNKRDQSNELEENLYTNLFSEQTNKSLSHPSLYIDLKASQKPILVSISNSYLTYVKQEKIIPICSTIKYFRANGIVLEDDSFHEIDAVIHCNRKEKSIDDFLQIVQIRFDSKSNRFTENIVYKFTFHPNIENVAFVGLSTGHVFVGIY